MILGYGKYDHHQKNRNGKRTNGIYYSSIGLLWQEFGKQYLEKMNVKYVDKTFEYMDKELIQYIDAADNMQTEFLDNKIVPDFIKLANPEWNENISEDEAFINALRLADSFWDVYIKHAIAEVEAIAIILKQINESKECYVIFDKEMPYRKAIKLVNNKTVKYLIFKSRREGYEIRTINSYAFKDELVNANSIQEARNITKVQDLIYKDNNGKLCCSKSLESAIQIVRYNEEKKLLR